MDGNLLALGNMWYNNLDGFAWPPYGLHVTANDARRTMQQNVRCSFGSLGDVAAESITYDGYCFRPEIAATGLACAENTTVVCVVPMSADAQVVDVGLSCNGNDIVSGPHFVPVGYPNVAEGAYTFYVAPIASQLMPPGGASARPSLNPNFDRDHGGHVYVCIE